MFHSMCSLFVYIVSAQNSHQTHIGLTSNLVERVWQHRSGQMNSIGLPSECHKLVWYKAFDDVDAATAEVERLSLWPDAWLSRLITADNPEQADLWRDLEDQPRITLGPDHQTDNLQSSDTSAYPVLRPLLKVA